MSPNGLGMTTKSPQDWLKRYGDAGSQHQKISTQEDELRSLREELCRVSGERDTY